ncbi:MAG: glycosyltransferase family 2 protein [Bacteroides sp.]|nr:glycosyltransferase family 2 protein [Bacteroides sp.]
MSEPTAIHSRLSTGAMRDIARSSGDLPIVINLTDERIRFSPTGERRMSQALNESCAAIVYSNFHTIENDGLHTRHELIDYQPGSLRDDFDFGPIVMVNPAMLRKAVGEMEDDFTAAGWYDLRLRLSRMGDIIHIPETLYTALAADSATDDEEKHFSYVNPRNRASQIEMERAVTAHLTALGALVDTSVIAPCNLDDGGFPVEASVIIPVRNRCRTIADAVSSALSQRTDFSFNVIVIDNGSTDGTYEILERIAADEPRLHIIRPTDSPAPGIGGCWNLGVNSPNCGRFAIQLDSDDIYNRPDTLQLIVDKFRSESCAMVIGAYSLTDFDGRPLPPGLIDHAEWTRENGPNNALRINGLGAPRAFYTPVARKIGFPDVSYGEDYAMGLAVCRQYPIGRIYESLYSCRRWEGNSDHALSPEKINRNNHYKDRIRTIELLSRIRMNASKSTVRLTQQ